jgi:hypothetical protein
MKAPLDDLIPHQLHLTNPQIAKLLQGLTASIPHKNLGADKGDKIMLLSSANAEKMLKNYKSGTGVKVKLSNHEIASSIAKGRGIEDIFKSPIAQKVIDKLVDKGIDRLLGSGLYGGDIFSDIFNNPTVQRIGMKVVDKGIDRLLGGKVKGQSPTVASLRPAKGSPEMKEKMARLRALKKGGGGAEDFFNKIGNAFKQTYNQPPRSEAERKAANFVNENLIARVPSIVSRINPDAGEVIGLPINAYLDSRRKIDNQGRGVSNSKAYRQATKQLTGVDITPVVSNAPVSKFKTNPKVRPSSDQMTLSPYQNPSAPAMNPFVPTRYTQEGGTQSGYGGRGLY